MKLKNVIYQNDFNIVGGTEAFVFYLVKKYSDYDIAVLYKTGHPGQIERLKEYCPVFQLTPQTEIECEKLIFGWDVSVCDKVEAKEYYSIIHADFKRQGLTPRTHPKITKYLAVSQTAADGWEELTGIKPTVVYNPLALDKPKKVLRLISATRLTKEKGKKRMDILADKLTAAGISFQWLVFTNSPEGFRNPNVIKVPPRLDLIDYIADADYLVQLSDSEAYCYSVNEALALGTPVIVTDLPTFREEGVIEGKTGYLLPLDMDVDVKKLLKIPKVEYSPRQDTYDKILAKGKSDYRERMAKRYIVEATEEWQNLKIKEATTGKIPLPGDRFEVNGLRLESLLNNKWGAELVKIV